MNIRSIGIIGHGAVGIMYGDALTRTFGRQQVCFIADQTRIKEYQDTGATLNGVPCGFRYVCDTQAQPVDLLLFTVKYTGLAQAIASARRAIAPHTILVSALNGVVSEQEIAAVYGDAHLLYCTVQGMDATKHGTQVTCTQTGYFALGLPQGGTNDELQAVCQTLHQAGIAYQLPTDILHHQWSKCMLNVGVNQVTAARGLTYGGIQQAGEARAEMIAAMHEAQCVAATQGIVLTDAEIDAWVALMDKLDPAGMTSMRQDTLHKRKTELALFAGTICRIARENGMQTPVNDRLYAAIRALEEAY